MPNKILKLAVARLQPLNRMYMPDDNGYLHAVRVSQTVGDLIGDYKRLKDVALLHDIVEDTDIELAELRDNDCNDEMLSLIGELTNDNNKIKELGRCQYMADKFIHMTHYALLVKFADRLDNLQTALKSRDKMTGKEKSALERFITKYFCETFVILQRMLDEGIITKIELMLEDEDVELTTDELAVLEGILTLWNELWELLNESVY